MIGCNGWVLHRSRDGGKEMGWECRYARGKSNSMYEECGIQVDCSEVDAKRVWR